MKKQLLIIGSVITLVSCGNKNTTDSNATNSAATTETSTFKVDKTHPDYIAGIALVKKSDCLSCHHETKKLIGPSYTEIAAKFPNTDSTLNVFATKIIKGSKGEWGDTEMTPHPTMSQDDAMQMAKYVMTMKAPN